MNTTVARKEYPVENITVNGEEYVIVKVEHFYHLFVRYMESKNENGMVDWANYHWYKVNRIKKKRLWNKKTKQLITMMYHYTAIKIEEGKNETIESSKEDS